MDVASPRPEATSPTPCRTETLVDCFRTVCAEQPELRTYRFLDDSGGAPLSFTNAELDLRARAIAATLRDRVAAGERALIVCPPGLDYVASFFGCLYAGVIAVPVYPPNPVQLKRTLPRLVGVVADSQPGVVLAPAFITSVADQVAEVAPALGALPWQPVDDIDTAAAQSWKPPAIVGDDVAFLQYTSGSTGSPKGVMVTHANLLHNLDVTYQMFFGAQEEPDRHLVIWLPPYHDMGLIGGLLQPMYAAFPVTIMSPLSFLKRPARWLRAISDFRATISGGPNFSYDLCVEKITDEERDGLDLSAWKLAFNGAEPIRGGTIDRFTEAFAPYGFRRRAFYPCYGLAEGTLLTAGTDKNADPVVRRLRADGLAANHAIDARSGEQARLSVGCGRSVPGQRLVIVDPEDSSALGDRQVGEIWVSGPSVARGYWRSPEQTDAIFGARLDTGEGPFLRTGDLGFLDRGEVFVTGRRKDVIIIAGKNHYPQDIELSAERSHQALRPGGGAACSLDNGDDERLLLVHEVAGTLKGQQADQIISAIRSAVAADHDLQVHDIALVRRGVIPKTSSGKVQRVACRAAFIDGSLDCLARWSLTDAAQAGASAMKAERAVSAVQEQTGPRGQLTDVAEIERWLCDKVGGLANVPADQLDPGAPTVSYGLRSVDMVGIAGDLERWLGRTMPATLMWEYPTIDALAAFLAGTADRTSAPHEQQDRAEPVAIIGIGCRFPGGADNPRSYWKLLCEGRDAVTEVPGDRWDAAKTWSGDRAAPGRTITRWGGFVDAIDMFDPQFFGISPREAARMDPQQRLLAEVAWEALEDAGIGSDRLAGSPTGVYVGIATNDYGRLPVQDFGLIDAFTGTGNAFSIAANRLSYLLDLRGPSMAIDTACSSSLVAVYQACQSLAHGDCSLALAGGVNVILSPALAINFSKAGAMAPDGRCKAFDARADGYVRAEGAGIVVLKPLCQAVADGDRIYATILGGAVNQDGRTNGLMAPSPRAQEAVLRAAYARAGVSPALVRYVEAHGTGTLLGDPIEAKALAAVVGTGRDRSAPCLIGSAKSNIGHLEAAAGIAGLIKTALVVKNKVIPPSLHYRIPNPHIQFEALSLKVADTVRPWPTADPALAGVSSFGFGGTNAHLVVQEAPAKDSSEDAQAPRPRLLTLSARSEPALRDLAARYQAALAEPDSELSPASLCAAAALRRSHHEHRLACVGSTLDDLKDGLGAYVRDEERPGLSAGSRQLGRRPSVAFVFSGQGPRWWPIAADLIASEPTFREALERCESSLRRHADWSLLDQLTADPGASRLADTEVGQPALCAVQIALAALWQSWGVEPAAVVGHSVGEIAAAHVSGALSLDEALTVAFHRGRVISSAVGKGRMAVVGLSYEQAGQALARLDPGPVWISASNGPSSTVLSGTAEAIERVVTALDADDVFARLLESVFYASHCPQMDGPAAELRQALAGLEPGEATLSMLSTVTGEPADAARLGAGYWAANLTSPVLLDQAITALIGSGSETFIEIAAHPMLGAAVAERLNRMERTGAVVASLRRDEPGLESMLGALGQLYCAGLPIDWPRIYGPSTAMVALPSYAWQRERCWLDEVRGRNRRPGRDGHPVLDTFVRSATEPAALHWTARIDLADYSYLRDHQVDGVAVLPAASILEMTLAAATQALGGRTARLEDVRFSRMTPVGEQADDATLQLVLVLETAAAGSFRLFSAGVATGGATWSQVAEGRFLAADPAAAPRSGQSLADARDRCTQPVDRTEHYARLRQAGLRYGPSFQGIGRAWRAARESVGQLRELTDLIPDQDPYLVHPALLDSSLQLLAAAIDPAGDHPDATFLPVGVGRFTIAPGEGAPRWARAVVGAAEDGLEELDGSVVLFDEVGRMVGEVADITLRRLESPQAQDPLADGLFEVGWDELPRLEDAASTARPGGRWWLLFADRGGTCDCLGSALSANGDTCVSVTAAGRYLRISPDRYEVDPGSREDMATLLADLRTRWHGSCAGVVHAWSLDTALDDLDAGPRPALPDIGCVSVLHLIQELATGAGQPPRLVLLTRGAQRTATENAPPAVGQAALWGLARVVALEHGELRPAVIDLDPAPPAPESEARMLLAELASADSEDQIALRGGKRYAPRLRPWSEPATADADWERRPFDSGDDSNHRILAERPGLLDSLTPTLWRRDQPGPGEVEIEIAAAGLNFSDVLKAMDAYPGASGPVPLGAECAGRVTAVGDGAGDLRPGEEVMAVAPSSLAAFTTTPAQLAVRKPRALSLDQAAATPIAFLTALYGLERLARLTAGEQVLIHSATGGVGMAALQVARRAGAEIVATAGTQEKRELLRSLGVTHVMDSRSLSFADQIMDLTGGRGVDVVLNSLAGEALIRSLKVLAPHGRFVEIGKQDIYQNGRIGLAAFKENRSFFAVDLERTMAERPGLIADLLSDIADGFDSGAFQPLPVTAFDYSDAGEAFTRMARARHTGKIVLRPGDPAAIAVPPIVGAVRATATYLVTGGLGALGLETARYLVDQGARHLVLLGRHGPSPDAQAVLGQLEATGADVTVRAADVASFDDIAAVIAEIDGSKPALGGVVHAAGVLDDGLLLHLDKGRFGSVAEPKAAGAWNLHRATLGHDLDFFVMYSSAAALLGSPSQGNYAAANAFMDSVALYRRWQGLPALSVNWGPWSQIGLAARPDRGGALAVHGIASLRPEDGIAALDRLLRSPLAQACVLPLDREKLRIAADSGLLPKLLTELQAERDPREAGPSLASEDIRRGLLAVEPGRRRRAVLGQHVTAQVARVLKLDESRVDPTAPLANMGFDSMMSLELRTRLERSLDIKLPATVAWRYPTIEALVPFLADCMGIALDAAATPAVTPSEGDGSTDRELALADLTAGQIESLLLAKITQINEVEVHDDFAG